MFPHNIYIKRELMYINNMSKNRFAYNVQKEIKKLNSTIDLKIIKGLPYRAEARRHRFLMSQFNSFEKKPSISFFQKNLHIFTRLVL